MQTVTYPARCSTCTGLFVVWNPHQIYLLTKPLCTLLPFLRGLNIGSSTSWACCIFSSAGWAGAWFLMCWRLHCGCAGAEVRLGVAVVVRRFVSVPGFGLWWFLWFPPGTSTPFLFFFPAWMAGRSEFLQVLHMFDGNDLGSNQRIRALLQGVLGARSSLKVKAC